MCSSFILPIKQVLNWSFRAPTLSLDFECFSSWYGACKGIKFQDFEVAMVTLVDSLYFKLFCRHALRFRKGELHDCSFIVSKQSCTYSSIHSTLLWHAHSRRSMCSFLSLWPPFSNQPSCRPCINVAHFLSCFLVRKVPPF